MASAVRYRYVGPPDLQSSPGTAGADVTCPADLEHWLAAQNGREAAEPFTFVVTTAGLLRLAPRRRRPRGLRRRAGCARRGGDGVHPDGERNIVREGDFTCALCESNLGP